MANTHPILSVVCPIHNEEDSLSAFFSRLLPALDAIGESCEIICVNDGSRDGTLNKLRDFQKSEARLRVVDLSRNFGKEAALTCGIDHALGDAVIPIDADLQDPPELIVEMVRVWRQGFDVVLAQRMDRSSDHMLKRKTAEWFYHLHNAISEPPIPVNVGDFRLMDRRVVDALKLLPERRRFMKGLFAWVGFRQATLPYVREARTEGESKFSGWRLWNFALEGITSFSTAPLRIWTYLGLVIALLAFTFGLFVIGRTLMLGRDLPGYASLITVVLFLGGVQLIGLGVLGEYIGRLYGEAKGRPIYIVRERYDDAT
jgi:glycosyltransferase involved in cell wall biosynthesis